MVNIITSTILCSQCQELYISQTTRKKLPSVPISNLTPLFDDKKHDEMLNKKKTDSFSWDELNISDTEYVNTITGCRQDTAPEFCKKCKNRKRNEERKNVSLTIKNSGIVKKSTITSMRDHNDIRGNVIRNFWISDMCMNGTCTRKSERYGYCRKCFVVVKKKK